METSFVLIVLVLSGIESNYAQETAPTTTGATETPTELESDLPEADGFDMGGIGGTDTEIKDRLMSFFNGNESISFASDARINLNGEVVRP